jgi:hypothetical protein
VGRSSAECPEYGYPNNSSTVFTIFARRAKRAKRNTFRRYTHDE